MTNSFALTLNGSFDDLRTLALGIAGAVEGDQPAAAYKAKISQLEATTTEQASTIENLRRRLAAEEASVGRLRQEVVAGETDRERLIAALAGNESQIAQLTAMVETLRGEIIVYRDQAHQDDGENERIRRNLSAMPVAETPAAPNPEPPLAKIGTADHEKDGGGIALPVPCKAKPVARKKAAVPEADAQKGTSVVAVGLGNVCRVSIPLLTVTGPKGATRIASSLFAKVLAHMSDGQMYGLEKLRNVGGYATDDAVRTAFITHRPALTRIGVGFYIDKINARIQVLA